MRKGEKVARKRDAIAKQTITTVEPPEINRSPLSLSGGGTDDPKSRGVVLVVRGGGGGIPFLNENPSRAHKGTAIRCPRDGRTEPSFTKQADDRGVGFGVLGMLGEDLHPHTPSSPRIHGVSLRHAAISSATHRHERPRPRALYRSVLGPTVIIFSSIDATCPRHTHTHSGGYPNANSLPLSGSNRPNVRTLLIIADDVEMMVMMVSLQAGSLAMSAMRQPRIASLRACLLAFNDDDT